MNASPTTATEPTSVQELADLAGRSFDQELRQQERLVSVARWPSAFRRRFPPHLLEVAQAYVRMDLQARAATADLRRRLAAARARQAELAARAAALQESVRGLRAQRERLASELQESTRQGDEARWATAHLRHQAAESAKQRHPTPAELDAWRQRVAAMERTRAWRLRAWFLRVRGRG